MGIEILSDVIVVGLGAVGSATVFQLGKRGAVVLGIDRFTRPNEFASCHGESRITREHVGEGLEYVPLVKRSHEVWEELETYEGELRVKTGMLTLARKDLGAKRHGGQNFLDQTLGVAATLEPNPRRLDANEIRWRFPQFNITDDTVGYFERDAGFVRPERCVDAQLNAASLRKNVTLKFGEAVTGIHNEGGDLTVVTDRGRYKARKVIVAAGAWSPGLITGSFGETLRQTLGVYRQVQYWFAASQPEIWQQERAPVFVWFHGGGETDVFYGLPMVRGGIPGVKVATEQYTATCDPSAMDRTVSEAETQTMYATHVADHLVGVTSQLVEAKACLYTVNGSGHGRFVIAAHPEMEGLTVVSACSGHGFKHSAGIGAAIAAQLTDGAGHVVLSSFALPMS